MRTSAILAGLLLAAACAAMPSCALVLGDFDNGSGGQGTTHHAASSSTGPMCSDPKVDCPDPMNECVAAVCTMGKCDTSNVTENTPVSMQVTGDCKQVVCDGLGLTKSIDDDNDLPDDGNVCTTDTCNAGTPSNAAAAPTTKGQCMVNGSPGFCGDPAGAGAKTCVECNVADDCTSKVCQSNACKSAMCGDGVQNGDETDMDCGGSCGPCADTKMCDGAGDCISKVCDMTAFTCTPATCSDMVQNQGESDLDCGAVCASEGKLCDVDQLCGVGADCKTGVCDTVTSHACLAATCSDGVQNQDETDADCGGTTCSPRCADTLKCAASSDCTSGFCDTSMTQPVCAPCTADAQCGTGLYCAAGVCAPTLANGAPCAAGTNCTSTFCADNICCDTACNGVCLACNLTASMGTCSNVAAGQVDPGTCMGTSSCNGAGACLSNNGVACAMDAQCLSGHCADGVCCNTACNTACQSCTATLKGAGSDGVCGDTKAGGSSKGLCSMTAQSTCGTDGICAAGGVCEKWPSSTQCAAATCAGNIHKNATNCNGNGTCNTPAQQDCTPYACKPAGCPNTCAVDADCTSGNWCDPTNHCASKLGNGASCSGPNQCTSGNCVDGVCCNSACTAICQSCNGSTPGTCSNIPVNGTDNSPTCNINNACDGAGNCKVASGFPCGMNSQCASGVCKVNMLCQ